MDELYCCSGASMAASAELRHSRSVLDRVKDHSTAYGPKGCSAAMRQFSVQVNALQTANGNGKDAPGFFKSIIKATKIQVRAREGVAQENEC